MNLVTFEHVEGTVYHIVQNPSTKKLIEVARILHRYKDNCGAIVNNVDRPKDIIDAKTGLNFRVSYGNHRNFPHCYIIYKVVQFMGDFNLMPVGYFTGYMTEMQYESLPPVLVYVVKHSYFSTELGAHSAKLSRDVILRYTNASHIIHTNVGEDTGGNFAVTTTFINPTMPSREVLPLEPQHDASQIARAIALHYGRFYAQACTPGSGILAMKLSAMPDLEAVIKAILITENYRILGRKSNDSDDIPDLVIVSVDDNVATVVYAHGVTVKSLERQLYPYAKYMIMESNAMYPDSEFIAQRFRRYAENYHLDIGPQGIVSAKAIMNPYL